MKNFAKRVSALVLALVVGAAALCPTALAAARLPDLPKDECVVDDANILSDSTTQTIVDLNNQLQSSCNGAQIGVLTVDYTGNYSTEDYATQAFNAWGIGSASENNGVLILLVMESPIYEDGDYYVTYGDGFRNTTLESQASALAQTMEGDFVNRDYSDAVITCANNVADTIASVYGVNLNNGSYDDGSYNDGSYAEPDDGVMAQRLMSAVLGGTPNSKFFVNVREKYSLCYYCAARYDRNKGILMVDSGVETQNIEKAEKEILNQIHALQNGDLSDFEMDSTKLSMTNSFNSMSDTVGGTEAWYISQLLDKEQLTPEEASKRVMSVSAQQVIDAARKLTLDTVYILKPSGAGEEKEGAK